VELGSGVSALLSQVPFISPFLILTRAATGDVEAWEVLLSVGLMLVTIGLALWIAARIYRAGVLLYGQRPSIRTIWRLARSGM
jgi:ABC-2 type transport system permease protein